MRHRQYQLVFEFAESTDDEPNNCRELYCLWEAAFENNPEVLVDGYDSGGGYFNIFVHTNTPLSTFDIAKKMLDRERPRAAFRSAYRDFDLDEYVPVHPPGLTQFKLR